MITTVTREELQHLVRHGEVVLLEALPPLYFDTEHLPGAQNLPLDEVETLAPRIVPDKTTPIVTYCTGLTCPNFEDRRNPTAGPRIHGRAGLRGRQRRLDLGRAPRAEHRGGGVTWNSRWSPSTTSRRRARSPSTSSVGKCSSDRSERATSRHRQRVHPSRRTAAARVARNWCALGTARPSTSTPAFG